MCHRQAGGARGLGGRPAQIIQDGGGQPAVRGAGVHFQVEVAEAGAIAGPDADLNGELVHKRLPSAVGFYWDEAVVDRVDAEAETLQGVAAQQRDAVVLAEYEQSD